jgi:hypothetical protein
MTALRPRRARRAEHMAAASGESGSRFVSDAVPIYAMVDSIGLFFSFRRLWNAFLNSTVSRSFDVTRIRPEVSSSSITSPIIHKDKLIDSHQKLSSPTLRVLLFLAVWRERYFLWRKTPEMKQDPNQSDLLLY